MEMRNFRMLIVLIFKRTKLKAWVLASSPAGKVAKLVEYNRLKLPSPVADWLDQALAYPGIRLLDLTPRIVVESTQLPGTFHRDPADQMIVATARIHNCPVMTVDAKILAYPHVQKVP